MQKWLSGIMAIMLLMLCFTIVLPNDNAPPVAAQSQSVAVERESVQTEMRTAQAEHLKYKENDKTAAAIEVNYGNLQVVGDTPEIVIKI